MTNRDDKNFHYQPFLPLLLNVNQVSELLGGMPPSTIRKYVNRGLLERCRGSDRPWYFTLEQVERFKQRLECGEVR